MSLPEPEEIERLAIGDLRALVTSLLAEGSGCGRRTPLSGRRLTG